jgi:hypothetical protein
VPTLSELGYDVFDGEGWNGLVAPAKTPKDVIARLAGWFSAALRVPDVAEKLAALGSIRWVSAAAISPLSFASDMMSTAASSARPTSSRSEHCVTMGAKLNWATVVADISQRLTRTFSAKAASHKASRHLGYDHP